MRKFVEFYNGEKMPVVGLGTGKIIDPEDIHSTITKAVELGYRHIDTAFGYKNEEGIGKAIKFCMDEGKVARQELFITTKLPLIGMHADRVGHFVNFSLKRLQLDYIDLYLIHWPVGLHYVNDEELMPRSSDGKLQLDMETDLESVWKSMEEQVTNGKVKSIGISNFNEKQIQRILNVAKIHPANLQIEVHAAFQQNELREFCHARKISICAYAPLGSPGRINYINAHKLKIPRLLDDPIVKKIAASYDKSPAQILLKYLAQVLQVSVIPKSVNPKRLQENINIFDFELKPEEIKRLEELDEGEFGRSLGRFDGASEHPECPF